MKEISIIVPIYNKEKYIENFIKSVIGQTLKNFELILVDDGSTDKSIEKAKNILEKYNIDYKVFIKENGGQSTARNLGIDNALGKWLVFPDADDALQNDYLEVMYNKTLQNDIDVIICNINNVTDNTIFTQSKRNNKNYKKSGKELFKDFIMHKVSIGPTSIMIRREFIEKLKLRFNENSKYSEEFIFISHLLYNANNVIYCKDKLYNYCLRKGSVSTASNIDKIIKGYNEILKSNAVFMKMQNSSGKIYRKYAIQRWILATARFTAKNLKYNQYLDLIKELNAKVEIKKLLLFPDIKVIIAAIIFEVSTKLFYRLNTI